MLTPQFQLDIAPKLVVDLFAGGGGASTGIERAIGRHVDIAINHDAVALSMHAANHPQTEHYCSDVYEVNPEEVCQGRQVGLLWASPDCKHFSKAKGGKPVSTKIRSLAWVVIKWAKAVKPDVICLENVEEFATWGPLDGSGFPCKERKGQTFKRWLAMLKNLGYQVEYKTLVAADYGTPTIRKRLFLVARCDGQPIVWPEASHGNPKSLRTKAKKLKPWRTAAECIDWSIPCPSIFERKKPLVDATCRRVAKGVMQFVIENNEPFIVQYHSAKRIGDDRVASLKSPLHTQTVENRFALVVPFLTEHANASTQRVFDANQPLRTICAQVKGGHFSLVTASFITKYNTGATGFQPNEPLHTIIAGGNSARPGTAITQGVVTANLQAVGDGLVANNHRDDVYAFLIKYYSSGDNLQSINEPLHTVTSKGRFGLVTVRGVDYQIVDIGLRMLTPAELFKCQGVPEQYQFIVGADGKPLTKAEQVRMCGNMVCPPVAEALVRANYSDLQVERKVA